MGLVTPTTIKGRILMRDIWESGIGWDDIIKGDSVLKWHEWITELKLPRCYSLNYLADNKTELHVFCDASSKAYAAAAYMRVCYETTDNAQLYDVALIASRARVSPLIHVTIPKLETLAAVLGCRLADMVEREIKIHFDKRFFWTDSRTTLSWINSDGRMQTFVANRIGEICEKSKRSEWNWVPTDDNIADIITLDVNQKQKLELWIKGRKFLESIFCEAEHLVNNRPYLLESDDPDDGIGLCPNDIIRQQSVSIHVPCHSSESLEKRTWQATQVLIECFWKRFLKQYLPTLVNRPKWTKDCQNLRDGEIVLKTFPGEDNVVRVAEVKAANNVFRRPVSSLRRLQIISDRHYRVETET
ncbi:hypothetical protein ACLKA6_000699 [Drosophila palustris]